MVSASSGPSSVFSGDYKVSRKHKKSKELKTRFQEMPQWLMCRHLGGLSEHIPEICPFH